MTPAQFLAQYRPANLTTTHLNSGPMQSIENSLVSVVIPVVPGSHSLGQCLEKVVRQDFPNKEVIVVCAPGAADAASLPTRTKGV
ncbi:unnamed protein product, partial [marine sediment metagenome]